MTRLVEVSASSLAGVRTDVADVRDVVEQRLTPLRARAWNLAVPTTGFDDALRVGDRLSTSVLPVIDTHLDRARSLEHLRYGSMGPVCVPVVDAELPLVPEPSFTHWPAPDGGTQIEWTAVGAQEQQADEDEAEESTGIGGWFGDRWGDVTDAASEAGDWVASTAGDAWDKVTEAGAAIGDWWEATTADLGSWIDQNLDGLRDFIGRHVGIFRFLADALRIIGWVVVVIGVILAIGLAIIGAMGGAAIGAVFGFGVGAVPGGGAGAVAGLAFGLKIVGVGFSLVGVGDFLDVAADWGERKIDGQDLVKLGSLELGLALTSLIGFGAAGKILQRTVEHLPASWRSRLDELLKPLSGRGPRSDAEMRGPLRNGAPSGPGWNRRPDVEPDPLYGQPRVGRAPLAPGNGVPSTINPKLAALGGDLNDPWGIDPRTLRPFTQREWEARFSDSAGEIRWPPNRGAAPGTRIEFHDPDRFMETYGDQFDRIGGEGGDFLGVPPGTSFDGRALPPGHLDRPLHGYTYTGKELEPGVTIEVSEIAPAFGREGGGIQVRFMENGKSLKIWQLLAKGYLK